MARNTKTKPFKLVRDRHLLYEEAVQSVDYDVPYISSLFARRRGRPARTLREDFCGTAALAAEWVKSHRDRQAWGVDIHAPTLQIAEKRKRRPLGKDAERLTLIRGNVLTAKTPLVDVVTAMNFSYWVFKTREQQLAYFKAARSHLKKDGIFLIDLFGGTETMEENTDARRIKPDMKINGQKMAPFDYVWETSSFNPVDHHLTCFIHFHLDDGTHLPKAFRYDWRMWTLPELQELMREAGFANVEVHVESFEDDVYRRRRRFSNEKAWLAYVIGFN